MTITRDRLYINGAWVKPKGDTHMKVHDSATGDEIGSVVMGVATDVNVAAEAAAAAFPSWQDTSVEERAKYLDAIAENLRARLDETIDLFMREVGTTRPIATGFQSLAVNLFASNAEIARTFEWQKELPNSTVASLLAARIVKSSVC